MTATRLLRPGRLLASLVLLGILAVVSGCAIQPNDNTLPGQTAVGDDGYTITVHFDQVENLVPNSTVQRDNVVIGTVGQIDVQGWEAVVKVHLLRSIPLPANATFSIGQKTLLGAQYVEVSDPGGGASSAQSSSPVVTSATGRLLRDGDVIGVEQTGSYPSTEQILGSVALLLNNGGLSQISTITGEFSTALRKRAPDARGLVRQANELLAVLDANKGEIITALESLNNLSAGLRKDQRSIATAIDRITPGLRVLNTERNRLVKALTHAGRAGDRAARVIQTTESALLTNLDALGPILSNLGKVSASLPEALKIAVTIPFPAMTTTEALRGDYANLFATVDLTGTALTDSFLPGVPLALQAGDPVMGPLSSGAKNPQQNPDPVVPDGTTAPENNPATPTSPAPTPSQQPQSGCLLALLGLC